MELSSALIVAEPGTVCGEIDDALQHEGFQVQRMSPDVLAVHADPQERPDLLLVASSVGHERVAVICSGFADVGTMPATLVFPDDGDLELLELCVKAGFDYILPPFLPGLLRSRMTSCWDRSRLTLTSEQEATSASLREYERDLSIAHDIQSGFLPDEIMQPPNWQIDKFFRPAKQVGGDFYDVFELVHGRRLGLVVADVCDKGVGAALFMALIRTLLRHTAQHADVQSAVDAELAGDLASTVDDDLVAEMDEDLHSVPGEAAETAPEPVQAESEEVDLPEIPAMPVGAQSLVQAVVGTNRYLTRNHLQQGYFATMFFAVLDPESGAMLYINGGHNPPVLRRADGRQSVLMPTGPAVGMMPDGDFTVGHDVLAPGDCLFIYSDGVVEAHNPDGELFGLSRLTEVVDAAGALGARELVQHVDAAMSAFVAHAGQFDDITMLAVSHTPPTE